MPEVALNSCRQSSGRKTSRKSRESTQDQIEGLFQMPMAQKSLLKDIAPTAGDSSDTTTPLFLASRTVVPRVGVPLYSDPKGIWTFHGLDTPPECLHPRTPGKSPGSSSGSPGRIPLNPRAPPYIPSPKLGAAMQSDGAIEPFPCSPHRLPG